MDCISIASRTAWGFVAAGVRFVLYGVDSVILPVLWEFFLNRKKVREEVGGDLVESIVDCLALGSLRRVAENST